MGEKPSRAKPRMRIFVCCDGTAQNAIRNDEPTQNTNVQRFKQCVSVEGSPDQFIYESGVGTHAPENAGWMSFSSMGNKGDQVTGSDIHTLIHKLYYKLCEKYHSNPDAEIHLIGFSRGAFAVRCLVCLIERIGLLRVKGDYVTKKYKGLYRLWASQEDSELNAWAKEDRKRHAVHPVKIASCGVWDTVSAIMESPTLSFVDDKVPENLDFAFQALALHESRSLYNPILWKHIPGNKTCIRQCWFAGDHSDIGGGWPDCGLANLTLVWMLAQYVEHFTGMPIYRERLYRRLCPPGAGSRYLSHTLSQGNVNHCLFPPTLPSAIPARQHILEQDAGVDGYAPFQESHQRTIHFTVRLFLAKGREEVTKRTCLLTAGSTRLDGAAPSYIAWLLEKTKKSEGKKHKDEGKKDRNKAKNGKNGKNREKTKNDEKERVKSKETSKDRKDEQDMLIILEDKTTKWENDVINTWTTKAQKLVDKDVDNIFEKGIREYDMTIDKLVRGYNSNALSLTVEKLVHRNTDLGVEWACKMVVDWAWHCSLEYFLHKNKNQGTCEAVRKFLYHSPVESTTSQEASDDPHDDAGDTSDGGVSEKAPEEPEDVTSYDSQRISSTIQ